MSHASLRTSPRARTRSERLQSWVAAFVSALLHLLLLLLLLSSSVPTVSDPDGAAGGSRMKVDFVGDASPQPVQSKQPASPSARHAKASTPVQTTLVQHAEHPLPPHAEPTRTHRPEVRQATQAAQTPAQTPSQAVASLPPSADRHPETWTGRPPGMLEQDSARENAGLADSASVSHGNGRTNNNASGSSLEVGGYQVYYDLLSEERLRAWKAQGMKELFIPLPGTEYQMVCPLEVALRRGSSKCRLLPPDSPELKDIGDARKAIIMMDVYHEGERLWHGPGPYR